MTWRGRGDSVSTASASQRQLYRIHRAIHRPWFFDGSGNGRFDPAGTPGRGTCYRAVDPLGAWVEAFRTRMLLTSDDLTSRRLSVATLGRDVMVRDLASRRALKAGVTAALTAGGDYTQAQALADALQDSVPAVRWRLRHDLGGKLIGVAWFGDEGAASKGALVELPPTHTEEIPEELAAQTTVGTDVRTPVESSEASSTRAAEPDHSSGTPAIRVVVPTVTDLRNEYGTKAQLSQTQPPDPISS